MRMAAVFTISVSTLGIRTAGLPRWVSFLGYLVALTLLLAAGEHRWFQLLFPAWVLLVSIVILVIRPQSGQLIPTARSAEKPRGSWPSYVVSPHKAANGARTGRFGVIFDPVRRNGELRHR
jgi:hypothetical protein